MKNNTKLIWFFLISALFVLFLGCASFSSNKVSISTSYNITSVTAGGSLSFRASGREIVWSVSSTSDGRGPVASNTFISSSGMLTVDRRETASYLYITARSNFNELSDTMQIRIVTVSNVSVSPVNQTVVAGKNFQFRADVSGNNNPNNAVTWAVSSNASGTGAVTPGTQINSNGVLSVSSNESLSTIFIVATSRVDPSKSGRVSVVVVVPTVTSVKVGPQGQSVAVGRTLKFSAAVLGTHGPSSAVTWKVSSNASGTGAVTPGTSISSNGTLTVSPNETLRTLFVFAVSVFDPSKQGSVSVSILPPSVTRVSVTPANQSVNAGQSIKFAAQVVGTNNPNTSVVWRVSSNSAGTGNINQGTRIDSNGLLTVATNESAKILYVFASSVFDPSKAGSVSVNVIPVPKATPAPAPTPSTPTTPSTPSTPTTPSIPVVTRIVVNPPSIATQTNRTIQFVAVVSGTNNPDTSVTWKVGPNPDGSGDLAARTAINSSGALFIAPNEWNPTLYVIAVSAADTTRSAASVVKVTNANPNQGSNQGN